MISGYQGRDKAGVKMRDGYIKIA